jgi:Fe-S-cluster containining protein
MNTTEYLDRKFEVRRHDCTTCGACCAYSYDWPELMEDDGDGIAESLIDCETGRMKCTGDRCNALAGTVGVAVRCTVYAHRPTVCREFDPCPENCDRVRAWFGLPAMTLNGVW